LYIWFLVLPDVQAACEAAAGSASAGPLCGAWVVTKTAPEGPNPPLVEPEITSFTMIALPEAEGGEGTANDARCPADIGDSVLWVPSDASDGGDAWPIDAHVKCPSPPSLPPPPFSPPPPPFPPLLPDSCCAPFQIASISTFRIPGGEDCQVDGATITCHSFYRTTLTTAERPVYANEARSLYFWFRPESGGCEACGVWVMTETGPENQKPEYLSGELPWNGADEVDLPAQPVADESVPLLFGPFQEWLMKPGLCPADVTKRSWALQYPEANELTRFGTQYNGISATVQCGVPPPPPPVSVPSYCFERGPPATTNDSCVDDNSDTAWLSSYTCATLKSYGWCDESHEFSTQTTKRCSLSCDKCAPSMKGAEHTSRQ